MGLYEVKCKDDLEDSVLKVIGVELGDEMIMVIAVPQFVILAANEDDAIGLAVSRSLEGALSEHLVARILATVKHDGPAVVLSSGYSWIQLC